MPVFGPIKRDVMMRCYIKNEFLVAGTGELPPIECWPQLCVDDDDFEEAKTDGSNRQ